MIESKRWNSGFRFNDLENTFRGTIRFVLKLQYYCRLQTFTSLRIIQFFTLPSIVDYFSPAPLFHSVFKTSKLFSITIC